LSKEIYQELLYQEVLYFHPDAASAETQAPQQPNIPQQYIFNDNTFRRDSMFDSPTVNPFAETG
jgi:hypothetical protein